MNRRTFLTSLGTLVGTAFVFKFPTGLVQPRWRVELPHVITLMAGDSLSVRWSEDNSVWCLRATSMMRIRALVLLDSPTARSCADIVVDVESDV